MLRNTSSFRDSSGFIFEQDSSIYRCINKSYQSDYNLFTESGLKRELFEKGLLIEHEEISQDQFDFPEAFLIIKPEKLALISYPYEWSFSQLKAAALITLEVMKHSLDHGMILKDASGFNVQFKSFKPIFIDTLSFANYQEGQIWYGYRQFCEHFLAPLSISAYMGVYFQSLLRLGVDGIPLKMATRLLPWHTWLKSSTLMHIHAQAISINRYGSRKLSTGKIDKRIPKRNLYALVDHLYSFIDNLRLKNSDKTQWQDYDQEQHYSEEAKRSKADILRQFVTKVNPKMTWDIGSNDGRFSRIIAESGGMVLSLDADPWAVEKNFNAICNNQVERIYPLIFDLTNPSPSMGWANQERSSLVERSKPDLITALALIHHLVITFNIPLNILAEYLAVTSQWLIIEFVPPEDEKIKTLPETPGKKNYTRHNFDRAFLAKFVCVKEEKIVESNRTLLLLQAK